MDAMELYGVNLELMPDSPLPHVWIQSEDVYTGACRNLPYAVEVGAENPSLLLSIGLAKCEKWRPDLRCFKSVEPLPDPFQSSCSSTEVLLSHRQYA